MESATYAAELTQPLAGKAENKKNAGRSLSRRFLVTRVERYSAPVVLAPRLGVEHPHETLEKCGFSETALQIPVHPALHDADMQRLIDAWPTLPEALRAGILAMIDAARKDG